MNNDKRYFIMMYMTGGIRGDISVSSDRYPVRKHIAKTISELNKFAQESIIFTNIIELSKEDYDSWNGDINE